MGPSLTCVLVSLLPLQQPQGPVVAAEAAAIAPAADAGLRLAAPERTAPADWALGDGGVRAPAGGAGDRLPGHEGECTTPGGVRVECRREGVRLRFDSGREVLFAPDGYLHLRDGAVAGPFPGGAELRLLDGAAVRITRNGSRRTPIARVEVVTASGDGVRLWQRRQAVRTPADGGWFGDRLYCLGDGDSLYRALALGPVLTLQRVLGPRADRRLPAARLVLMTGPLLESLQLLVDSRTLNVDPAGVAEAQLLLDERDRVWATDTPPPPRTSTDPLRFLLRAGYDLEFAIAGGDVRMTLARHGQKPFVEWQLGYGAAVRCVEGKGQPTGPDVTLPPGASLLQPRLEHDELVRALQVFDRLRRGDSR
ncbi:MAG: hypothetical protein AB7O97_02065 [Planctomycetota bacterium]